MLGPVVEQMAALAERPMLGFESFRTARRTLAGVESMAMLAKG